MFYQACKVSGKNSTPCVEKKLDGTIVIEIELKPDNEMTATCDCVGILKVHFFYQFDKIQCIMNVCCPRNEMLMLNTDFPINRVLEVRKNQPDVAWFSGLNSHMTMEQLNLCKFVRSKLFAVSKNKKKI